MKKPTPGERHLCDMRNDPFKDTWDKVDAETRVWRRGLVSDYDDNAAKAKVTFVLPETLRTELQDP